MRILAVVAATLLACAPLSAAAAQHSDLHESDTRLSSRERAAHLAINGALGSFSAAMVALAKGKDPWRAALQGFGGGIALGAGKQIAGNRFDGAGLLGRHVAAFGTSLVRSATEDTLVLLVPVGPVTMEIRPRAVDRVRPRVNVVSAGTLMYYIIRDDTRIDWSATLSSGAPVFRFPTETVSTRDGIIFGRMDFGTILLGARPPIMDFQRHLTLPHESIHIAQYDFLDHALALPPERAILRKLGVGEGFLRHIDLGVVSMLLAGMLQMHMDYDDRPWEREAVILTEGRE